MKVILAKRENALITVSIEENAVRMVNASVTLDSLEMIVVLLNALVIVMHHKEAVTTQLEIANVKMGLKDYFARIKNARMVARDMVSAARMENVSVTLISWEKTVVINSAKMTAIVNNILINYSFNF